MKKNIRNMFGAALIALSIAGCSATAASTSAMVSKTDDKVIQDYLDASKSDVKFSYSVNGSLSKWTSLDDEYNEETTAALEGLETAASELFTTVELTPVEESEINADNLIFELQPAQGELIYIYSDGYLKTVGNGNRNFYKTESTVLQDAAAAVSESFIVVTE